MDNPKAIKGAMVDYTLIVDNTGVSSPDANSLTLSDTLPTQLELFVGDFNGSGSPFIFNDATCPPTPNASTSGLSLNYPADVVFKDASNNVITASPNYDTNIRHFEITLSGTMNAKTATTTPCFNIKYRTRVK